MNEHALAAVLRDAVRREIRTCAILDAPGRPTLPPPHDLGAEHEVLEAVLSGRVRCSELAPLTHAEFYSRSLGAFFGACAALERAGTTAEGASPSLDAVARLLATQGVVGPELLAELHRLRDETPAAMRPKRAAVAVLRAARLRSLCEAMARLDGALRLGVPPSDDDARTVAELVSEGPWRL